MDFEMEEEGWCKTIRNGYKGGDLKRSVLGRLPRDF